jgi:hypothetical protein
MKDTLWNRSWKWNLQRSAPNQRKIRKFCQTSCPTRAWSTDTPWEVREPWLFRRSNTGMQKLNLMISSPTLIRWMSISSNSFQKWARLSPEKSLMTFSWANNSVLMSLPMLTTLTTRKFSDIDPLLRCSTTKSTRMPLTLSTISLRSTSTKR